MLRPGWKRRELLGSAAAGALAWLGCGRDRALEITALSDLAEARFDVCVIGSGPAGAVLAGDLVARGLRVAVLESGVAPERAGELGWDPAGLDAYRAESRPEYPIEVTRLRALGGASNLWEGRSARLDALDFEPHPYTPRHNPWPLGYADLRPWYEQAERTLGVKNADSVGPLDEICAEVGLDPEAPRFAGVGRRHTPLRAARDLWPDIAASARSTLVCDATVTGLESDANGRVELAVAATRGGELRRVEAEHFVVACGALESARMLLLSRGPRSLRGLGNASGWVGRGFCEHPVLSFRGTLPREHEAPALATSRAHVAGLKREGFGAAHYTLEIPEDRPRELRIRAALEMFPDRANRLTLTRDHSDLHGNPGLRLFMRFGMRDRASFEAVRGRIRRLYASLDARDVVESEPGWSHHQLGTCRMGTDPQRSVVDADLRVHGTRNLYVASSAVFPTAGAAPPTLTIAALAHRLAKHLADSA